MTAPEILVRAVGTALPGPAVTNAMLARRFGMKPIWEQWVETFIGTRTRHLAVDLDTAEIRYSLADLGETAGRRALAGAGIAPRDVDLVVLATATPDTLMPTTVNIVADRLGINRVRSYQLQSGCTGAIQALDVASQLLLTGRHRTALVLGGDVCAKHFDLSLEFASRPAGEQVNTLLFGDGAGAAVLTTDPVPGAARLSYCLVELDGLDRAPGQTVEWFGLADRHEDRPGALEDYKAIEEHVPPMSAETLDQLLAAVDWKKEDLDYLLPPQLSGRMTQRIAKHLDVPSAAEVSCVADTGNTGNALPFFQLEALLPRLGAGQRAALVAIESSKWIKSGLVLEG